MKSTYENLTDEQVRGYLARLGMEDAWGCEPTKELFDRLAAAHQMHVPFENLSVYLDQMPISLEVQALYQKIVTDRRGGYCFEMNGLFISLLRSMGFDAWSCLCRVVMGREVPGGISHRGNIARFGDRLYFTDVGFGGPMPAGSVEITSAAHQMIGGEEFWVTEEGQGWYGLMRMRKGSADDYDDQSAPGERMEILFQTAEADPADFVPLNYFQSMNPQSFFRMFAMANIRTESGYVNLSDMTLTIKKDGEVSRIVLQDEPERTEALKTYFGINL